MRVYLARFTLTPATWARLIDKPEDRRQALEPVIAAVGGKLRALEPCENQYGRAGGGGVYMLAPLGFPRPGRRGPRASWPRPGPGGY